MEDRRFRIVYCRSLTDYLRIRCPSADTSTECRAHLRTACLSPAVKQRSGHEFKHKK
ncbi:hypothetical protein HAX54_047147, partial [Datura stramonium]|nr:hypothetical protein [Datura stramonium]